MQASCIVTCNVKQYSGKCFLTNQERTGKNGVWRKTVSIYTVSKYHLISMNLRNF